MDCNWCGKRFTYKGDSDKCSDTCKAEARFFYANTCYTEQSPQTVDELRQGFKLWLSTLYNPSRASTSPLSGQTQGKGKQSRGKA